MKNKKYLYLVSGILLVVVISVFVVSNGTSVDKSNTIQSVKVVENGNELNVFSDGSVVYKTSDEVFYDLWSKEKTDAFFNYIGENYSGESEVLFASQDQITVNSNGVSYSYSVPKYGDELLTAVVEDSQTEDSSSDSNSNSSSTSTPSATSTSTSNTDNSSEDTCLYWKISYCVIKRTAAPVPTATGTPDPNANVIEATGCGDYVTGGNSERTIISNTVCLPTPTPN